MGRPVGSAPDEVYAFGRQYRVGVDHGVEPTTAIDAYVTSVSTLGWGSGSRVSGGIGGRSSDMALVTSSGFAHVRITVTDIARSKAFYDQVFGWPTAVDASGSVDEPGVTDSPEQFYGGTVYETPQGTLFGLRPVGSDAFDAERTGLDHVSFAVAARADLEAAASALGDVGIEHGEVTDLEDAGMAILSFQDPDDINIELSAPLG